MPIKLGASDISLNFSKAYLGGTLLWSASIAVKADSTAVLADNSTIRADAT